MPIDAWQYLHTRTGNSQHLPNSATWQLTWTSGWFVCWLHFLFLRIVNSLELCMGAMLGTAMIQKIFFMIREEVRVASKHWLLQYCSYTTGMYSNLTILTSPNILLGNGSSCDVGFRRILPSSSMTKYYVRGSDSDVSHDHYQMFIHTCSPGNA